MSTCARCGAWFSCSVEEGSDAPCWCMQLPPVPASKLDGVTAERPNAGCLCRNCLEKLARDAEPN